jgi:mono/diheme cytochrome c family protein
MRRIMTRRSLKRIGVAVVALTAILQLVPYGRSQANPPPVAEPPWDSPRTRALAQRACFDCHSNETRWPAYGRLAPVSWLLQHDVSEGREELNFSEWHRPQHEATNAAEAVREHEMPPLAYRLMHSGARLNAEERDALARGLLATLAAAPPREPRVVPTP